MKESEVIKNTQNGPVTVDSLVADFQKLGVKPGQTLLVHSSLSALGWVCGGAVAVILALEQVLGADGTLVMPARAGGVVAHYPGDHASLQPRPNPHARNGRHRRKFSQAIRRRAEQSSPILVRGLGRRKRASNGRPFFKLRHG